MFASRSPVGNFICVEVCCCQSCSCVHVEAAFGIHPSNIDIPSEFQKVDRQEEQRPQNVDRRHWHYNRKEVDIVTIMFDPNIVSSTRSITSSSRLPPDTEVEEDAQNQKMTTWPHPHPVTLPLDALRQAPGNKDVEDTTAAFDVSPMSDGSASLSTSAGSDRDSSVSPSSRRFSRISPRNFGNSYCRKRKNVSVSDAPRPDHDPRLRVQQSFSKVEEDRTRPDTASAEERKYDCPSSPAIRHRHRAPAGAPASAREPGTRSSGRTEPPTTFTASSTPVPVDEHEHQSFEPLALNVPMFVYMPLCHVLALLGLFYIPAAQNYTLIFAFALWPISGLGITAGCHRLWAHRSYKAHFLVRVFLMLCNSIANQKGIFHWARDHRVHHIHSDTGADPHDSRRGLFFAHMGWLFYKKPKAVIKAGGTIDLSDLRADSVVMFQKRVG